MKAFAIIRDQVLVIHLWRTINSVEVNIDLGHKEIPVNRLVTLTKLDLLSRTCRAG